MNYFEGITDLEQAKLRYREVAKQLHPDKGGTAIEFQKMQEEYKILLVKLQQNHNAVPSNNPSPETELLSELGKLATVLLEKQVPQEYLKQRMTNRQSPVEKRIYSGLISFLDKLV
ncbi:J domain-containing protein [Marinilabilia salmonicolor]|uniref:DnaJ-like protein n=1 Tax=Marinilabilia salmonicolor TaxID=989 RepID=A0A368UJG4_9BACT|nr:J domain-containing protein [Marinilabilia salmonicolor]RCW28788.1 hypothetical protein DFO77_13625 [Marinilabilia salmonicolor]